MYLKLEREQREAFRKKIITKIEPLDAQWLNITLECGHHVKLLLAGGFSVVNCVQCINQWAEDHLEPIGKETGT